MVWQGLLDEPAVVAVAVLILGIAVGYLVGKLNKELLTAAGLGEAVEGTALERSARSLGTSTVELLARSSSWFVYGIAVLTAIHIAQILDTDAFWLQLVQFVPRAFVAAVVLIGGLIVADRVELAVSESFRSVKLPEISLVPQIVRYSILYVAIVLALGQIGVNVAVLLVLLALYAIAVIVVGTVAFRHFLVSSGVGIYLLLNQPYGIGDEIRIGDRTGIVQEVDVFVTKIESDSEEYVVPNRKVFEDGLARVRE